MSGLKTQLYALLGKAIAGKSNKYDEDEKHAILAFVLADNSSQAQDIATKEMLALNWKTVGFNKVDRVNEDTKSEDEIIATAISQAKESGFGVVVYSDIEVD